MTPTARTLARLRKLGYAAGVVERFIRFPPPGHRSDLFGCIDVVGVKRNENGVLGIQATTIGNMSSRIKKAKAQPPLAIWLASGNRWECWGWVKKGHRWAVKVVALVGEDLEQVIVEKVRRSVPSRHVQRELF